MSVRFTDPIDLSATTSSALNRAAKETCKKGKNMLSVIYKENTYLLEIEKKGFFRRPKIVSASLCDRNTTTSEENAMKTPTFVRVDGCPIGALSGKSNLIKALDRDASQRTEATKKLKSILRKFHSNESYPPDHEYWQEMRKSTELGANVNHLENSQLPLPIAAKYCNFDMVKFLVEHGAGVNLSRKDSSAALHEAMRHKTSQEIISYLLEQPGIDVCQKGSDGWTALEIASAHENIHALQALLKKDKNVLGNGQENGYKALKMAAMRGNIEIIEELIKAGLDIDHRDVNGNTVFMLFARTENKEGMNVLLEKYPHLNQNLTNNEGLTAAQLLANKQQEREDRELLGQIAELLKKGDNITSEDIQWIKTLAGQVKNLHIEYESERLILAAAVDHGNKEIIEALIEKGADVDAGDAAYGNGALEAAIQRDKLEILKLLFEKRKNANQIPAMQLNKFLNVAIFNQASPETVRLLIEKGADVNSAYPHDTQVTHLGQAIEIMGKENDPAKKENLQKIIDLLKEHGARETFNTEEPALS